MNDKHHKNIEDALIKSEERYKKLLESITDYIYTVRIKDRKVIQSNHGPGCVSVTGYYSEEYDKDQFLWYRMIYKEDIDAVLKQASMLKNGKQAMPLEHRIIHKNGSIKWVRNTPVLHYNDKGEITGYDGLIVDITEKKEAEKALQKSAEQYNIITNTSMDGFAIVGMQGNIIDVNEAYCQMMGYSKDELLKLNVSDIEITEKPSEHNKQIKKLFDTGTNRFETKHKCKNGSIVDIEVSMTFFSQPGQILVFLRDISERKKSEHALIKFNEELEKRVNQRTEELINVNKELESFSYTVSHDLRAPLRSINGFSNMLLDEFKSKLDKEAIEYLNRIINSSNKLAELIDHLLSLSRITRSEIKKTRVDLSKIANDIIIELKEINPERKINFKCKKNILIDADYTLIHSALYNLIQNAWKYSSKKSNTKIEFGETKELYNRVFYIKDNGVGFDMKYSDKLFKIFQRLHSDKEYEGTGIGLATVNRIINKHGGSIWAESEIDKGTTIYFTLE